MTKRRLNLRNVAAIVACLAVLMYACDNSKSVSITGTEWSKFVSYDNAWMLSNLKFVDDSLCQYSYVWNIREQSGYYKKDSLKIDFLYKKIEKNITLTPISIENGAIWEAEIYKKDEIRLNNTGNIQIQIDKSIEKRKRC